MYYSEVELFMKYFFGLLFLVLIVLFESSVLPFFSVFGVQPSFLLVILLALQFLGLSQESYYGAFFGGVLLDLLGGGPFGFSGLILLLLSGAAGLVRRFAEGSPPVLLLITFVASVAFRVTRVFPILNPTVLCKGGLLDVGVMMAVYPMLRYVLKSVFGKRELQVGI